MYLVLVDIQIQSDSSHPRLVVGFLKSLSYHSPLLVQIPLYLAPSQIA